MTTSDEANADLNSNAVLLDNQNGTAAAALTATPSDDFIQPILEEEPLPVDRGEHMKSHLRAVLAAQPFRGDTAIHKEDVLALFDALIDGPDGAE